MGWDAGAEWVWATYRPARVVIPYGFGNPLEWDGIGVFRRRVWMRSGAPSAMGTEPCLLPMAAQTSLFAFLGPDLDQRCVYVPETNEIREAGEELYWMATGRQAGIRYEFSGAPVTYAACEGRGFRHADGTPVVDPRAEFADMLRVDEFDEPVVEAGVPLWLQLLALMQERAESLDAFPTDTEVERHVAHVHIMAGLAEREERVTVGAWLDLDRLRAMQELPTQTRTGLPSLDDELVRMAEEMENWPASRPGTRHGPGLGIAPMHWGRRDAPGWGKTWRALDAALGVLAPHDGPPNGADLACLPVLGNEGAVARIRAYLGEQEMVAGAGDCAIYRDGEMRVWSWEAEGIHHFAAARDGTSETGLRDPLLAEDMVPEDRIETLTVRAVPGAGGLGSLDTDTLFDGVEGMPDYVTLALLTAHDDGLTFADLCASFAEILRWPLEDGLLMERIHDFQVEVPVASGNDDDEAVHAMATSIRARADALNARCVAALRALGGQPSRRLDLILRKHDDYGFGTPDVDMTLALVRACKGGLTLEDIAGECVRRLADA